MDTAWIIAGVVVGIVIGLGGALMTVESYYAHVGACTAFLLSGMGLLAMDGIWLYRTAERDWTVYIRAVGLAVCVLAAMPLMIWFAWPANAQTPPSIGNCNAFGNNNSNCSIINPPAPHSPTKLYLLDGREIGDVVGISPSPDQSSVSFGIIIVPDDFPWSSPVQLQGVRILCDKPQGGTSARIEADGPPVNKYWSLTCKVIGPR